MGVVQINLFASRQTKQLPTLFLWLETRPRSTGNRCVQSRLVPEETGELPQASSSTRRSGDASIRAGFLNESGCTNIGDVQESFISQGISPQVADLLLASWKSKTKLNYDLLFAKWACWCQSRQRNPTTGPIKDIVNFLAEFLLWRVQVQITEHLQISNFSSTFKGRWTIHRSAFLGHKDAERGVQWETSPTQVLIFLGCWSSPKTYT